MRCGCEPWQRFSIAAEMFGAITMFCHEGESKDQQMQAFIKPQVEPGHFYMNPGC